MTGAEMRRALADAGLDHLIEPAQALIGDARRHFGTNDCTILFFVEEGGATHAKSATRENVLESMLRNIPQAVISIERLATPLPPDRFFAVIIQGVDIYCIDLAVPAGTAGILN